MTTDNGDLLLDDSPHTKAKHQLYRYYLDAWLPILIRGRTPRVRIVDGFAGPGRYRITNREGSPQIGIRAILENAQLKPVLNGNGRILLQFIEQRADRARHLEQELATLPAKPLLRFEVKQGDFASVWSAEMGRMEDAGAGLEPTLIFVDGFGYSGFPLDLLTRARRYPSCEVLINFPWLSINQWALNDPSKHGALNELYGGDRWRPGLAIADSWEREQFFLAHYQQALADVGWRGTSFRMLNENNQTSYYLVFGTTNPKGMDVFKSAAWRVATDGFFQFSDLRNQDQSGFLRDMTEEMVVNDLKAQLLDSFSRQQVQRAGLAKFASWHPAALPKHLTQALRQLQTAGAIVEVKPKPRRRGTFPEGSTICFA